MGDNLMLHRLPFPLIFDCLILQPLQTNFSWNFTCKKMNGTFKIISSVEYNCNPGDTPNRKY